MPIPVPPAPARFVALDELRALAVFSMCIAHFAPGMVERFSWLQPYGDGIGIVGRLSTVAFVVCFGLTLGFIQFPRYLAGRATQVHQWLLGRSKLLTLCILIASGPGYLALASNGVDDGLSTWLWQTYGVLNFYVLAMLSGPLWFWMLRRDTAMRAVLLSAIHWMAYALLIEKWPQHDDAPFLEFARLNLASGGYAYLPLAAVSLLAIPVGIWSRQRCDVGDVAKIVSTCTWAGSLLAAGGYGLGLMTDMSAHAIAEGSVKGPARLWYWALFSGATVLLFAVLAKAHLARPRLQERTRYVALFGQSALGVFTLHAWVLPIVGWSDRWVVTTGAARAALALIVFMSFCGAAMLWYERKNRRRPVASPPPGRRAHVPLRRVQAVAAA